MSNKVNIGEVLSKAWKIIWKFKVLWIFGILASCAGGNNSRYNFNNNSFNRGSNNGSGQIPPFFQQFMNMRPEQVLSEIWRQYNGIITGGILLLCVLWFVFFFLGIMGKTGLIKGANQADSGATSLTFGQLWTESTPYFWRMFGLNILVGLPFFIIIVIMLAALGFFGYTTFSSGMQAAGMTAMMVGMAGIFVSVICVISILSIIVAMVVEQVQNAIVLEDLGLLAGFSRGWNVFKSAVLTIIVMAIILGIISGVIGFIMALPIFIIAIPAAIGAAAAGANNMWLPLVMAGGCVILYLPVMLVLGGILQAYTQSVWTLVYRRLTAQPAALSEYSTAGVA